MHPISCGVASGIQRLSCPNPCRAASSHHMLSGRGRGLRVAAEVSSLLQEHLGVLLRLLQGLELGLLFVRGLTHRCVADDLAGLLDGPVHGVGVKGVLR